MKDHEVFIKGLRGSRFCQEGIIHSAGEHRVRTFRAHLYRYNKSPQDIGEGFIGGLKVVVQGAAASLYSRKTASYQAYQSGVKTLDIRSNLVEARSAQTSCLIRRHQDSWGACLHSGDLRLRNRYPKPSFRVVRAELIRLGW